MRPNRGIALHIHILSSKTPCGLTRRLIAWRQKSLDCINLRDPVPLGSAPYDMRMCLSGHGSAPAKYYQ